MYFTAYFFYIVNLITRYFTLIKDKPTAVGFILPHKASHWFLMNWWGTTKINISASFDDSTRSGIATFERAKITHLIEYQQKLYITEFQKIFNFNEM